MALPLVALANQVIGDQNFAAAAHGRNWHLATERTCATACPLSAAQRKKFDARVVLNRALMTQCGH